MDGNIGPLGDNQNSRENAVVFGVIIAVIVTLVVHTLIYCVRETRFRIQQRRILREGKGI